MDPDKVKKHLDEKVEEKFYGRVCIIFESGQIVRIVEEKSIKNL